MEPIPRPEDLLAELGWLRALALRLLGDVHGAEDTAQAVLVRAIEEPPARREGEGLRGWLARLTKNEARSRRRSATRRRAREAVAGETKPAASPAASEIVARGSLHQRVTQAVLELPEPYASTVLYRYLDELTTEQVAERMDTAPATVRKRLSRAVQMLRERLERELDSPVQAWAPLLLAGAAKAPASATLAAPPVLTSLAIMATGTKLALTAAALAAMIGTGLYWRQAPEALEAPANAKQAPRGPALATADLPLAAASTPVLQDAPDRTRIASVAPESPADGAANLPIAHIHGRLVDQHGDPIPGGTLFLYSSYGQPWRSGFHAPMIDFGRGDAPGWRAVTGTDGAFSFRCPVPTGMSTLDANQSPYWSLLSINFGSAPPNKGGTLFEGDNDLGDLVLAASGALSGQIVDQNGAPIARARVTGSGSPTDGTFTTAITDDSGKYTLGHLATGAQGLTVDSRGYLTETVTSRAVASGVTLANPTIRLERAPTVEGIVVDEAGKPIAGITLQGWSRGGSSTVKSKNDGTFRYDLMDDSHLWLGFKGSSRYRPWGGDLEPDARFESGRSDCRIVLRAAPQYPVRVVDDVTGHAVERFGIKVSKIERGGIRRFVTPAAPIIADYPGGLVTAPAESGEHRLEFDAEGYAPLRIDAAGTPSLAAPHEVRLTRGCTLLAQVSLDGDPISGAHAVLVGARVPVELAIADDHRIGVAPEYPYDLTAYAALPQNHAADPEGRLRVPNLAPGTYRLELAGPGAATWTQEIRIEDATLDLGTLELLPGATIAGKVVVAANQSPIGMKIALNGATDTLTIDRADGSFTLRGLNAGEHKLTLAPAPDILLRPLHHVVQLGPGATRDVVIDATAAAPSRVTIEVTRGGEPMPGARIAAQYKAPMRLQYHSMHPPVRLATDAEGKATLLVHPDSEVILTATTGNLAIGRTAPFTVQAGTTISRALEVETGSLRLILPESLSLPELGTMSVSLTDAATSQHFGIIDFQRPNPDDPFAFGANWTSKDCDLGELATGRYGIQVVVNHLDPEKGEYRAAYAPVHGTVEILDSQETTFRPNF